MTNFQILSDLHLEFGDMEVDPAAEYLILAGDITVGNRHADWMHEVCNQFERVIFVTGNHEYYSNDVDEVDAFWRDFSKQIQNFHFLQQNVIEIDGLRIAGCTLWTPVRGEYGEKVDDWMIQRMMSDFSVIKKDGATFTPSVCRGINKEHATWLKHQKDIDIVITHHAPTWQSVSEFWRKNGGGMNPGFAGDHDDIIDHILPKFWIHGHMHSFFRYWHKGVTDGTQILCNPRGYVGQYQEQSGFKPKLTIEVERS